VSSAAGTGQQQDANDSFWRSLWFFSIYRLSVAILFLAAALIFGDTISLGTQDAACLVASRPFICSPR
jgi:hypothetical protein